jgi:carboxyl-terminal processing protease
MCFRIFFNPAGRPDPPSTPMQSPILPKRTPRGLVRLLLALGMVAGFGLGPLDARGPDGDSMHLGAPARGKAAARAAEAKTAPDYWPKVASIAAEIIETQHYLRQPLDFHFSLRALERYFEILDPDRLCLLQTDLEEFRSRFGLGFAGSLKAGNIKPVEIIHERFRARVEDYCAAAAGYAGGAWDFSSPWTVDLSREHAAWPADEDEARTEWIAQVGADLLGYQLEGLTQERARAQVRKRLEHLAKSVKQDGPKERLASALLALARAGDAHSDYLTQEELEDTENELRLTRTGIGVSLDADPLGLRVSALLPGGPAQRDGRLKVNDRIVAVAEENAPFQELEGLPMAQALQLLRGPKGALVRLRIAPSRGADPAQRVLLSLRREELRSRDGEAYAKLVEIQEPGGAPPLREGWLVVPGFYGDDSRPVERRSSSVSKDVAVLLRRLISEKVDGVVLDLRGNLGGLLDEAIELGGLFCGRVPIAAVRAPDADLEVLSPVRIKTRQPLYGGPLVVLTDRNSASASELVAGALQDYGRAVLVGGEQTFGKGSVQTTIALREYFNSRIRLPAGGLALTVGKFYRVSGQSTQLLGVRPDLVLPSTLDLPYEGEAALTDPLSHDAIKPFATLQPGSVTLGILTSLRARSEARVQASTGFAAVTLERDQLRRERRENRLSLQEQVRRQTLETAQKAYSQRETALVPEQPGVRFARLLLGDLKQKGIRLEPSDPLGARDPESIVIEREVLMILADLIQASGRPAATAGTRPK